MRLFGHKTAKTDGRAEIIEMAAHARMIVEGGPGTGKTATACARVIELILKQNIPAPAILVISFTRIAVREIAERIHHGLARNNHPEQQLRVVTLDALAAMLCPDVEPSDSHDDQIKHALSLLPFSPILADLRHLVVDEAHDVVGIRADLIEQLIGHLPQECGITLLSDNAQSIYDFADKARIPKPPLPARLTGTGMMSRTLTVLHRTQVPALTRLFSEARTVVLSPIPSPQSRHRKLMRCLYKAAPKPIPQPAAEYFWDRDDLLILYRHRADVLLLSHFLSQAGVPHRLRMSGLPAAIPPWVALSLAHHTEPTLSRAGFLGYWQHFVKNTDHAALEAEEAWEKLLRTAPVNGDILIPKLREKLLQASPPLELCGAELGQSGPTIGTIHASKGREAHSVMLALPDAPRRLPSDEECRVMFVAATRATHRLILMSHHPADIQTLPSGRLYQSHPGSHMIEMGLKGDVLPAGLAGRTTFATAADVEKAQAILTQTRHCPVPVEMNNNLEIILYNHIIAELSSSIYHDCRQLIPFSKSIPAPTQVHIAGGRTLVFDPAENPLLHSPWSSSGFVLAPIISGLALMKPDHTKSATNDHEHFI